MAKNQDLYASLDLPKDADAAAIKRAYRIRAKALHPDTAPDADPSLMRDLSLAYSVLSDPDKRKRYDETRREKWPRNEIRIDTLEAPCYTFRKEAGRMNSFEIYENGYENGVAFSYIPDLEKEDLQLWGIGFKDGKTGAHKAPEEVERVARMLYEEYAAR